MAVLFDFKRYFKRENIKITLLNYQNGPEQSSFLFITESLQIPGCASIYGDCKASAGFSPFKLGCTLLVFSILLKRIKGLKLLILVFKNPAI